MSRAEKRQAERQEGKMEKTFSKLSAVEKEKVAEYIEKKAVENADKAVDMMVKCLGEALLDFKIPQKKIDEIFIQTSQRMTDEANDVPKVKIPEHVVLTRNQISDLAEQTLHDTCKLCTKKEIECSKAKTFKRCGVPPSTWNLSNCKYASGEAVIQRDEEKIKRYQEFRKLKLGL